MTSPERADVDNSVRVRLGFYGFLILWFGFGISRHNRMKYGFFINSAISFIFDVLLSSLPSRQLGMIHLSHMKHISLHIPRQHPPPQSPLTQKPHQFHGPLLQFHIPQRPLFNLLEYLIGLPPPLGRQLRGQFQNAGLFEGSSDGIVVGHLVDAAAHGGEVDDVLDERSVHVEYDSFGVDGQWRFGIGIGIGIVAVGIVAGTEAAGVAEFGEVARTESSTSGMNNWRVRCRGMRDFGVSSSDVLALDIIPLS
mmetsp:Transcript_29771/g.62618  ORF Transcript_29771/g.62618 Transcript_29771/m.62618 type:complete len:252 (+) Transcript_29771:388-1143(+)